MNVYLNLLEHFVAKKEVQLSGNSMALTRSPFIDRGYVCASDHHNLIMIPLQLINSEFLIKNPFPKRYNLLDTVWNGLPNIHSETTIDELENALSTLRTPIKKQYIKHAQIQILRAHFSPDTVESFIIETAKQLNTETISLIYYTHTLKVIALKIADCILLLKPDYPSYKKYVKVCQEVQFLEESHFAVYYPTIKSGEKA